MKIRYIAMALVATALTTIVSNKEVYASSYWKQINGSWYYLSDSSKIMTGWIQDSGKWYYLGADGKMNVGGFKMVETGIT